MSDIITNRSVQAELVAMEARADRLERERDGAIRGREANAAAYMEAEGRAVEAEQEVSNLEVRYESLLREYDEAEQERLTPDEARVAADALDEASDDLWIGNPEARIARDKLRARAAVRGSGKEKPLGD